jgi:hypothetical protein
MNDLLQTYSYLNEAMQSDSLLCLANAVAWLDPVWFEDGDPDDLDDEHDIIGTALRVMRRAFPDIYIDAVERIRAEATYNEIDNLICGAVSAKGIPLDNLEFISYGIPMDAFGVELESAEFYTEHPDLVPVLALFGVHPDPDCYNVDVPEAAYRVGRAIALSLDEHPDERYRQISWLMQWLWSASGNSSILCGIETEKSRSKPPTTETMLQSGKIYTIGGIIADSLEQQEAEAYQQLSWTVKWLFSCSNNSCVDWDAETMYSVEPLAWTPEDVAFAVELIAEAETIMADAEAGLSWAKGEAGVLLALCYNARQIDQILANNAESSVDVSLSWPDLSQDPMTQIKTLLEEWGCLAVQSA